MPCFVIVLAVSFVICSLVKDAVAQGAQVQQVDNAEQFALLCRIYNVAKNPPINHVDLQDPFKIVEGIDAINASFADEKQPNEAEQVGNNSYAHVKPTTTREAAVAQVLERITQKAHSILEEIQKVNATRNIEKAKSEFSQVIFGEWMNESQLCEDTLKGLGERGNACGKPGAREKGTYAGKNLVVDFFCLCTMRADKEKEGIENVCGVKVGGKDDTHSWGASSPSGSSSMWASIKKGCGSLMHTHPKSTKEGYEAVGDFLKHLKAGGLYRWGTTSKVDGSNRKARMLGTGVETEGNHGRDLLCDGSRGKASPASGRSNGGKPVNHAGICIYYGEQAQWEDDIPWLTQLKTALASVEAANKQTATIQRSIEKLQMLQHRTEEIYETTKVISEIQNPVAPTNLQTAARRFTAYNTAWRYHYPFILPCLLLFF
ncbi:Variant surface glycoprotein [Trypanosoma congolense IL3000]|uniref:Variant surface glycoprotein n=1 Tax=Trypanosoma congolense (strain IL3000) TaxID=1068625 RepID=F9WHB3_TRYCI|nr:Variant surface glycoprotein [Trypanosoma congolense IL3000]